MERALTIQEFHELNKKKGQLADIFHLPNREGRICVATQFDLADSEVLHYHDEPHLTLILNGGVVDKRKNKEDEKVLGELMFFNSDELHQTINKRFPTKYVTLTFAPTFFTRYSLTEPKLDTLIGKNLHTGLSLLKIFREVSANDEFSNTSVEGLLFNLTDDKNCVKNSPPSWLNKVYELLNDNWNRELSLDELALAANVHPKTVSRYFHKYFACTIGEYRRRLRIEKSLDLIKNSKLSMTEIAYECSFSDQSHFIKTFKEFAGFSPKQFKKL